MSKVTLNDVGSLYDATTAANTINVNSATVETAFDNTLSRDGTQPNQMLANLDMNSNRILNLPTPINNLEPARLIDLETLTGSGTITINPLPTGGTTGQVLSKNSASNYDVSWRDSNFQAAITGRLTLVSGIAVPNSDVAGATTIYFTPTGSNIIANYNGTTWVNYNYNELSINLDSNTGDVNAQVNGGIYDVFSEVTTGTPRLITGPSWATGTSRSTGAGSTELALLNGRYVNANALVNARWGNATGNVVNVPVNQATWLGSFPATGNGQATDTQKKRYLYNVNYPSIRRLNNVIATNNWSWNPSAWEASNGDATNAVAVFNALGSGMVVNLAMAELAQLSSSGLNPSIAISKDGVSPAGITATGTSGTANGYVNLHLTYTDTPGLGVTQYTMIENGGGNFTTWFGNNAYSYLTGSVLI